MLLHNVYVSHRGWFQKGRFEHSEMWAPGRSPGFVMDTEFVYSEGSVAPWLFDTSTHSAGCHDRQDFAWTPA